jgi:UDP-N-acetylglucosamine 2-epimerase
VIARFHFAPTARAKANLLAERTGEADIVVTGNTVIDAFLQTSQLADRRPPPAALADLDPDRPLIFVTAHRRENHEAMPAIARAVKAIVAFPERPQILWPLHPAPQVGPVIRGLLAGVEGVHLTEPLDYAATVVAVSRSRFVLTDSGGLQEEAPTLGKPVLVMRRETERPEGIAAGTLRLVGPDPAEIVAWSRRLLEDAGGVYTAMAHASNPYGDGHAAERIVAWLLWKLRTGPKPSEFLVAA